MMHTIKKVEYVEGFKLILTFNDKKKNSRFEKILQRRA